MGPVGTAHLPTFVVTTDGLESRPTVPASTPIERQRARERADRIQADPPENYAGLCYDPYGARGWWIPLLTGPHAGQTWREEAWAAANLDAAAVAVGIDVAANCHRSRSDNARVATVGHWAVGDHEQLLVRVADDGGRITDEWVAAVGVLDALRDYSLLDETLASDYEHQALYRELSDAIKYLGAPYGTTPDAILDIDYDYASEDPWGAVQTLVADPAAVAKRIRQEAIVEAYHERRAAGLQ